MLNQSMVVSHSANHQASRTSHGEIYSLERVYRRLKYRRSPFEVLKTQMAANRNDNLRSSVIKIYQRGGILGFWQGLLPWALIEASTKGAVLLFTATEVSYQAQLRANASPSAAGLLGGICGGFAQAYTTMGFCTFMKTVEVTRQKSSTGDHANTFAVAKEILRRDGVRGLNKGVTAVALRQMTNWGSRLGIARFTEGLMVRGDSSRQLTVLEKIGSSAIGGALACWNHPLEVVRVEMQSSLKDSNRPANLNVLSTARYIYHTNGVRGFYRGVLPRIGLSVYLTILMVFGGDELRSRFTK